MWGVGGEKNENLTIVCLQKADIQFSICGNFSGLFGGGNQTGNMESV